MKIKDKLLKPSNRLPVVVDIFGDHFEIQRASAARIDEFNQKFKESADDSTEAIDVACAFILESMLEEDGSRSCDSVSIKDLKQVYCQAEIINAMHKIVTANLSLDEAKNG